MQSTRPRPNPNATDDEIAARVEREGRSVPSVAMIWRVLSRTLLITPEPRMQLAHSYLRFEADLPNECWQSDFTRRHGERKKKNQGRP